MCIQRYSSLVFPRFLLSSVTNEVHSMTLSHYFFPKFFKKRVDGENFGRFLLIRHFFFFRLSVDRKKRRCMLKECPFLCFNSFLPHFCHFNFFFFFVCLSVDHWKKRRYVLKECPFFPYHHHSRGRRRRLESALCETHHHHHRCVVRL